MRLVGIAAAAALLSGCSFLDGGFGAPQAPSFGPQAGVGPYGSPNDPCQIPHQRAPIPRGCHPAQVTIGLPGAGGPNPYAGGFAQQPQFGAAQQATGGYGSHAGGNVHTAHLRGARGPVVRKPRFRGALDLGVEKSFHGDIIDGGSDLIGPFAGYNSANYMEGTVLGSPNEGQTNTLVWLSNSRPRTRDADGNVVPGAFDERISPSISNGDVWSVPASIGLSGEYIVNDRATLFGRVGYAASEGANGAAAVERATVYLEQTITTYDENGVETGTSPGPSYFRPNTEISRVAYDFSDMSRLDLEAGGRVYFDPIHGQKTGRTVTPFVGASAGASRFNEVTVKVDRDQLFYSSAIDATGTSQNDADLEYYNLDLNGDGGTQTLIDAQWVPQGRLSAGVEWQVTPSTALAFETGVRVEGGRDFADTVDPLSGTFVQGEKGDTNVTVPFTLRGSFNF